MAFLSTPIELFDKPNISSKEKFEAFHNFYHPYIGHYFRNLYQILKYISKSDFDKITKKFYSNLIRAQLSSNELLLLFYNCIGDVGSVKFRPLLEEFEMLEHMPEDSKIIAEDILYYKKSAFGKNKHYCNFFKSGSTS